MSKISDLKAAYGRIEKKENKIKIVDDELQKKGNFLCFCFPFCFLLMFLLYLMGAAVTLYQESSNFGGTWSSQISIIILCPFIYLLYVSLNYFFNILVANFKIKEINEEDQLRRSDLSISIEDVDMLLKELENMTDEEVDDIPSFIVEEIIEKKKIKEEKIINSNSNKLKKASMREKTEKLNLEIENI